MSKQQVKQLIENRVGADGMVETGVKGVQLFRVPLNSAGSSNACTGSFLVEGDELAELVRNDPNQLITILLVSETESFRGMLWHAFASSRHETLRPPTLRLRFEN